MKAKPHGKQWLRIAAWIGIFLFCACASQPPIGLMGAYRFDDGRIVSIRESVDRTLRYRIFQSGESKRLHPEGERRFVASGFSRKYPVELVVTFETDDLGRATRVRFDPIGRPAGIAVRIGREEYVSFGNEGAEFWGRLNIPEGEGPYPAIVVVHGSGKNPATRFMYNGDFLTAHGIAVLTFDKRGTGRSTGKYTFDFHLLARDVVAAIDYLKQRPDIDSGRIGLSGYSQGGWVAPLAATVCRDVRFVLVSSGLVESPAEEARVETRNIARRRGVDETSLRELDELTLAAVRVISSGFKEGWDDFEFIKHKYKNSSWRNKMSGTVIGDFLKYPKWLIKILGPRKAPRKLPWYYNSKQVLAELNIPMAWFIAGDDEMAPNELAVPLLKKYIHEGKPYTLSVYDGTDHGMIIFREENGRRVYTGYDSDYYREEVRSALRFTGLRCESDDS